MDKRFLTAFLQQEKIDISGYKLDPFCFRHLITLEALESPFADINSVTTKNVIPKPEDILILLNVCSTKNWEEAFKKKKFKDWYNFSKMKYNPSFYAKVVSEVITYLNDSFSVPKIWSKIQSKEKGQEFKKETFHPSSLVITILMCKFGFSEEDAWNLPVARAVWYSTCFARLEGADVSIIQTEEEDKSKEDLIKLKKIEDEAKIQYSKIIKNKKIVT
jgi:hypothetical protein